MSTTPLIKTPQEQGGTFYTFSSAAKDLTKGFSNDNLKLVFSKFVCLNIPDLQSVFASQATEDTSVAENDGTLTPVINYMQLNSVLGAQKTETSDDTHMHTASMNTAFAEHIQNYVLNLEELILSDEDYDNTTNASVSERVFFKWLIETGAIRFRNATTTETTQDSYVNFVEADNHLENYSTSSDDQTQENILNRYNRVVKYIGDIDIINNVDLSGEAYSEVYINIPTEVGHTPTILFKSLTDENYYPRRIAVHKDSDTDEYIVGRDSDTEHPQGLSIRAFYDEPRNNEYILGYAENILDGSTESLDITKDITENRYKGESIETDSDGNFETKYSDANINKNDSINYFGGAQQYKITRSKLDGICIDFDESHYYKIVNTPNISTFGEFNGMSEAESFEFNAVLVYYDVIDSATNKSTARNLYGILLLDNVITNGSATSDTLPDAYIQRYPKFKPNKLVGQNGNSYGFKINLRFDVAPGTSGVQNIINDYNTFSMQVFSEAMAQLQNSTKILLQQRELIEKLYERIQKLETAYANITNIDVINKKVEELYDMINNNSAALDNTDSLTDLISKNADEITKIKTYINAVHTDAAL